MRALIVEDDPDVQLLLRKLTEARGHEVVLCRDAETAWAAYSNDPFPLVVLDWTLSGMSGLELCRKIRDYPFGENSVILAVTGRSTPTDLEAMLEAGADDYMTKPLDIKLYRIRVAVAEQRVREIDKRRQAEEDLKRVNAGLSRTNEQLKEVNKKLTDNHAHLIQSEKMASLGQLAAGIAHEINNPIGFLKSNLGTLTEYIDSFKTLIEAYEAVTAALDAGDDEALERARAGARAARDAEDLAFLLDDVDMLLAESLTGTERVREIVQGLKSFARVDEAEMKKADVNEGLETTMRMLWNELKYKCEVKERLGDLPPIRCFPGQLNQVFMNLLLNAVQAIPERGEITVETETVADDIVIRISDTGVGIPAESMSRLFTPFFTTKPVGVGTGLGLSISYGIIKKHGGRIEVDSELGKGTTFTIYLPITEEVYA